MPIIARIASLGVLLSLAFSPLAARAETEAEIQAAMALSTRPEITRILTAWAAGTVPDNTAKKTVASWALKERIAVLYPAVTAWVRHMETFSSQDRSTLTTAVVTRIGDDPAMRTTLIEGSRGPGTNSAPMVSNVREGTVETRTLSLGLSPMEFALARALYAAGALAGVSKVKYASAAPVALGGIEQLTWAEFPDWVLNRGEASLFSTLETYRRGLTAESSPTRLEVTQKMLNFAERGEPQLAKQLREAIANAFIKTEADRYPGTPPERHRTMTIDLRDSSDLRLARMLAQRGEAPGVEVVNWNSVNERHPQWREVNYPSSNQVLDRDGMRLTDILAESNFHRPDSRGPALWRTGSLLRNSYHWSCSSVAAKAGELQPAGAAK